MLEAGIIRPSTSNWSFPILLVPKKDGGKRFCVDFRKLNQVTKRYVYPLPLIDDILAGLGNSKVFTSLDLKSGYWQVPMEEKDKQKTSFVCHKGLFEFNIMPYGVTNGPSFFSELMAHVLQGINGKFAVAYLDDIVIYSPTVEDHILHLTEVFARLRKHGLKMKMSKCNFMQSQMKYLGFVVAAQGIRVDPDKVKVIKEMSPPKDVRGVRGFIGCVSYYRRFCPKFSEIAAPLIRLTKKYAKFDWTTECQQAFDRLKQLLVEAPTLAFPDISREYTLYTDASETCIGAVLVQDFGQGEQPIHYLSHKLSDTKRKWPIVEKEAYAIYYALQKLDHYLHGAKFRIRTDHKPLKYLLMSEMKNRKIQMWAIAISSYDCQIEYVKGKDNEQADMLSRLPVYEGAEETQPTEVCVINSNRIEAKPSSKGSDSLGKEKIEERITPLNLPDMLEEQRRDPELKKLRDSLGSPVTRDSVKRHYTVVDGLLYYTKENEQEEPSLRLLVPEKFKLAVLEQYHDQCAHWGIEKTFGMIRQNYHWVGLYRDVVQYVTQCITCKIRSQKKNKAPLQQMDEPLFPGQKWGLDLCGPYPESVSGSKYILTAVDLYSGWPEIWALQDKRAENIVKIILDELIPRFSTPMEILTDNAAEFKGQIFAQMCHELCIHHVYTSPYHPAANGRTERFHRVINDMLSKKTSKHLEMWDEYLPSIVLAYRVGHQ